MLRIQNKMAVKERECRNSERKAEGYTECYNNLPNSYPTTRLDMIHVIFVSQKFQNETTKMCFIFSRKIIPFHRKRQNTQKTHTHSQQTNNKTNKN